MELREHIRIIKKYRWLIVIVTILATLAAFIFSYIQPEYYRVSLSFTVKAINKPATQDYQYDGYYAIKASELFSQTIISWFMTPSILDDIYTHAEIDPQIGSLDRFTSRFKTKQYSAQNFVVTFKERDKTTAEKISHSIIIYVEENSKTLNQDMDKNSLFEATGSTPVIIKQKTPTWLVTLAAFIFTLIFTTTIAYLINYLKSEGINREVSERKHEDRDRC